MNRRYLFAFFSMLFACASAMALDGKSCADKGAQMKQSERAAFMKECLAQASDPSNVRAAQEQQKRATCEQNAKNAKLQGNEKNNYVSSCITENQAAAAKAATPATAGSANEAQAAPQTSKNGAAKGTASGKHGNSCARQASKKGLKGDERKQFLKDCKAS